METLTLEWFKTLAGQGTGWILFCIACYVIYKAWYELKDKDKELCRVREECDKDLKLVYEARLADTNRILDKANTVIGANTSTLADTNRVVESRAEAITAMKEVLSKVVFMQESDFAALRNQADRIEAAQRGQTDRIETAQRGQADRIESVLSRLMDIVRPGPKSDI